MIKLLEFKESTRPNKKYMIVLEDDDKKRTVHFGAKGSSDYTIHKDDERKKRYLDRHRKNEDWNDPFTAGALSRWILWNKKTLDASLKDFIKKFKIKDLR